MVRTLDKFDIAANPEMFEEYFTHLRIDADDEPELRSDAVHKIAEAFDIAEAQTNRFIVPATVEVALRNFANRVALPILPCSAITEVRYIDPSGESQTLSPGDYTLIANDWRTFVEFRTLPQVDTQRTYGVYITAVAGYEVASEPSDKYQGLPRLHGSIKSAVKMIAGNLMTSEGDAVIGRIVSKMPTSADTLLNRYRVPPYQCTTIE